VVFVIFASALRLFVWEPFLLLAFQRTLGIVRSGDWSLEDCLPVYPSTSILIIGERQRELGKHLISRKRTRRRIIEFLTKANSTRWNYAANSISRTFLARATGTAGQGRARNYSLAS